MESAAFRHVLILVDIIIMPCKDDHLCSSPVAASIDHYACIAQRNRNPEHRSRDSDRGNMYVRVALQRLAQ